MKNTLYSYDSSISEEISLSVNKSFISDISRRMTGWNCADIHRCVNDVTRLIVAGKLDPDLNIHLKELFHRCIKQVKDQYLLCGKLDPDLNIHLKELFHRCIKQVKDQYLLCGKCERSGLSSS